MTTMRDMIKTQISQTITDCHFTPTDAPDYTNTGAIHAMNGLDTVLVVRYNFQADNCQIELTDQAAADAPAEVIRAQIGPEGWQLIDPAMRSAPGVIFHVIKYSDGARLRIMLGLIHRLLEPLCEAKRQREREAAGSLRTIEAPRDAAAAAHAIRGLVVSLDELSDDGDDDDDKLAMLRDIRDLAVTLAGHVLGDTPPPPAPGAAKRMGDYARALPTREARDYALMHAQLLLGLHMLPSEPFLAPSGAEQIRDDLDAIYTGAARMANRVHSSDDMDGSRELAGVTEPVAVVVRPDGSLDVYGCVGVVDQRPEADPAAAGRVLAAGAR